MGRQAYKAAGFVSYGGVSGTRRPNGEARLTSRKIVPLPQGRVHSLFAKLIDAAGVFDGSAQEAPAKTMLDQLARLDAGAHVTPEVSEPVEQRLA
ncbi:MAG TPA: hypothetical protein VKU41_06415 [Polyangiaceae bacterium]|nr:hypothetical protein [Polyangiaceae bacterium]